MEKDNEPKGLGNSLNFGARIYDSRLGRWLSVDPLEAKYPSLSTYNFAGDNPIMFIDPDGERLVLANDANGYVLAQLQRLTADKLAINKKTGEVYIQKVASGRDKLHGTILLRAVLDHSRTTTITYSDKQVGSGVTWDDKDDKNTYNGGGVNPEIIFSKINGGAQYEVDGKTVGLKQKAYIVLGGELIHSLVSMDGNKDPSGKKSHTYIDIFGEKRIETRDVNELKTHGIGGYRNGPSVYRKWYPTENDLRRDNNEPERVSYESELEYRYRPENKEKSEQYEKENGE